MDITLALITPVDNEPRIRDLELGAALGFARARDIRDLIKRNAAELDSFGGLRHRAANRHPQGGRPTVEYWLNERQAILLCMFADTSRAAETRRQIVEVFAAWREGRTVHVREHHRRPPSQRPLYLDSPAIHVRAGRGSHMAIDAVLPNHVGNAVLALIAGFKVF